MAGRWWHGYDGATLRADALAGVALAALAVPQSLGYAAVAGVPVQVGLYTLPAAMLAYALLGTSRVLVVGPVSTVSVLSGSLVSRMSDGDPQRAADLTAALAIVAGAVLVAAGVARIGWLAEFLSAPIVTGFVTGLVVLIVLGELPSMLRVDVPAGPVVERLTALAGALPRVHGPTLAVGALALLVLTLGRRFAPWFPWSLFALVAGILAVRVGGLDGAGVTTVGPVPTGLPLPHLPSIALHDVPSLVTGGLAVAGVGLAEGLSAARLFATRRGERLDTDAELVAAGAANVSSGVFGGFGVAGSLSKTAAVERAGARTQATAVVASLLVIGVLVALAGTVADLPRAVLSAIVVAAVVPLVDLGAFRRYRRLRRNDIISALAAAIGVVLLGPLNGLLLAVGQSIAGLVYRSVQVTVDPMGKVPGEKAAWGSRVGHPERRCPDTVLVLRLSGPLFWANANTIHDRVLAMVDAQPAVQAVIFDLEATAQIDTTSVDVLDRAVDRLLRHGIAVYFVRVARPAKDVLIRDGLVDRLGEDHFWHSISAGVRAAKHAMRDPDAEAEIASEAQLEAGEEAEDALGEGPSPDGSERIVTRTQVEPPGHR